MFYINSFSVSAYWITPRQHPRRDVQLPGQGRSEQCSEQPDGGSSLSGPEAHPWGYGWSRVRTLFADYQSGAPPLSTGGEVWTADASTVTTAEGRLGHTNGTARATSCESRCVKLFINLYYINLPHACVLRPKRQFAPQLFSVRIIYHLMKHETIIATGF